jgi:hypothetical protein
MYIAGLKIVHRPAVPAGPYIELITEVHPRVDFHENDKKMYPK